MEGQGKKRRKTGQRGNAIIETTLLLPWILFLFMGVFDFGFYAYALIATENAARIGALHTSSTQALAMSQVGVNPPSLCGHVLAEMRALPNVGTSVTTCADYPLIVQGTYLDGAGPDGANASRVTVTYRTISLFALPWLPGGMDLTRTVEMRVKP